MRHAIRGSLPVSSLHTSPIAFNTYYIKNFSQSFADEKRRVSQILPFKRLFVTQSLRPFVSLKP